MRIRIKTREELIEAGWSLFGNLLTPPPGARAYGTVGSSNQLGQEFTIEDVSPAGLVMVEHQRWGRDEYWRLTTRIRVLPEEELRRYEFSSINVPPSMRAEVAGREYEVVLGTEWGPGTCRVRTQSHIVVNWILAPEYFSIVEAADIPAAPAAPTHNSPSVPHTTSTTGEPMKSRPTRNPHIARFRDAPRVVSRSLITCGFELETQQTEGHTWSGLENGGHLDEDRLESDVQRAVDLAVQRLQGYFLRFLTPEDVPQLPDFRKLSVAGNWSELRVQLRAAGTTSGDQLLTGKRLREVKQRLYDYYRDSWAEEDYRTYVSPRDYMSRYGIPEKVEVGSDGSVDGFEFRTRGALSYAEFSRAARSIFNLQHSIDERCSFHVHLQVKGVKHTWGARLQRAMVEYLVQQIDRVPKSVQKRWKETRRNQYISGLVTSHGSKYSFIHAHPQGTWEFRCFGAVDNYKDGMRCLDLAIEALQFAYSVLAGRSKLLGDEYFQDDSEWRDAIYEALARSSSLTREIARQCTPQVA